MRNFLKWLYTQIWVPIFGRILTIFIPIIEGQKPEEKPTYTFKDK